ncbi:pseudaminic acid biosynthesis-associated protein PseG [Clostridium sp. DL-VIII]|uniref:UDP-2,4-diacetamido-2,4, 6-trideoxy-beta-L-altropyranose hydrolase n=1 Tax=Clostridium sp. DL-VIII TaxID=641107 RepID=UPI00023B062E|nr:UDP-2,4-diacetamido-2,4,6-trideoxy-beta-L-altropyranose hydrolase [Clostridium sp. DL-VIII]EHJ01493.1 pseudaminic acid biosynthesis-associated protein PseG [Clostridium sp. DL-VIII]
MKIAIRADGGNEIGMGHIMRTLVLAKELSKKNEVFYICRIENKGECHLNNSNTDTYKITSLDEMITFKLDDSKYIQGIKKILSEGFEVILINEDNIIDELKLIETDLLITDSYFVNETYFEETKKIFKKTAYIDDINKYYFNVDFLINQNSDAEDFDYKTKDYTKLILGTDYILLRDEFKNLPKKHIKEKACDIMITVGGADPDNITENILSYIGQLDYDFHVVIGPSFGDIPFAEKYKNDNIKFYYNANMREIMQKCDIAISACGSTLYELSASGVPTLGLIIADNQNGIASKLNDLEIIKSLGWYDKIKKNDLINNLNNFSNNYKLRSALSEKASKLVDGKGAERIAKILCEGI